MTKKKILDCLIIILIILLMGTCGIFWVADTEAKDLGGVATITSEYKFGAGRDSLNIEIDEIAMWYDDENITLYGTISDRDSSIVVQEANIKLYGKGVDWRIGKVVVPFGFDNLDRQQESVFVTSPREDYMDYGILCSVEKGQVKIVTGYFDGGNYSIRNDFTLLNEDDVLSFTYCRHDSLSSRYMLSNLYMHQSTLMNFSFKSEWNLTNGDYWGRCVIGPGIFDFFGLMGGYYHVENMNTGIREFDFSPAFTYGTYIDMNESITMSLEWKAGEDIKETSIAIVAGF